MKSTEEKIEALSDLRKMLEKYINTRNEIQVRIRCLINPKNKPTRMETIMFHISNIFRKEKRFDFSQNEYFTCYILDSDIEFIRLIESHVDKKIAEIQKKIDEMFI
jgi:hypothetical protein